MSPAEKKTAAVLVIVLIAMIGIYFAVAPKEDDPRPIGLPSAMPTVGGSTGAETRVMGPEDAALKIIAFVPTEVGCHDATVAALMEAYEAYPEDIHLTLVDFFGPESKEWAEKLRVTCATVTINGEKAFDLEGRRVSFEKAEGGSYIPRDLNAVIDAEIERVKG